ncbi:hypothetical protein VPH35_063588 [Triticum aestivum]
MGFCCGPSDVKVLPKNTSSSPSPKDSGDTSSSSSSPAKDSGDGGKKKQRQGVKKEQGREKKKSNLDRAAMATPRLPFHSRPGLNSFGCSVEVDDNFNCEPRNTSCLLSTSSSSSWPAKDSRDGSKKKQQQGVKKEQGREKKKSNLDRAAMATPRLPFHSRPGLM